MPLDPRCESNEGFVQQRPSRWSPPAAAIPTASVLPSSCAWLASPWSPGSRSGEVIPEEVLTFVGEQIGVAEVRALETYATRPETRREHLGVLREAFGFSFLGLEHQRTLLDWLLPVALTTTSGFALARTLMDEPLWRRIVVVGPSTIERLVAKALLEAERHVAGQLDLWPRPRTEGRPRRAPRAAPRGPASQCPELGAPAAGGREPPLDDAPRESTSAPAGCGPRPGERRRRPPRAPAPARPRGEPPDGAASARPLGGSAPRDAGRRGARHAGPSHRRCRRSVRSDHGPAVPSRRGAGGQRLRARPARDQRQGAPAGPARRHGDRRARGRGRPARRRRARRSAGSASPRRSRRPSA